MPAHTHDWLASVGGIVRENGIVDPLEFGDLWIWCFTGGSGGVFFQSPIILILIFFCGDLGSNIHHLLI